MDTLIMRASSGGRGTAARKAAYNSRIGQFAKRDDLVHSESTNMPSWTGGDPLRLFGAADKFERKNGTAYCEVMVALPNELGTGQRQIDLARDLAIVIAGERPCLINIHAGVSSLEGVPNIHLHAMYCNRAPDGIERSAEGMFRKFNAKHPEKGGCRKLKSGRTPGQVRSDMQRKREEIGLTINRHLDSAGVQARVNSTKQERSDVGQQIEKHLGQARIRRMTEHERQAFVAVRR